MHLELGYYRVLLMKNVRTARTYKDEELISQNCWDKDGGETECE